MRKHDVRKWLHAVLDLLPVIVIPVFMIYSHRHTIDNYSISREEPNYVDFYQYVQNGKPSGLNNISSSCPIAIEEYSGAYKDWLYFDCNNDTFNVTFNTDLSINVNDKIYFSLDCAFDSADTISFNLYCDDNDVFLRNQYINQTPYFLSFINIINVDDTNCSFAFYSVDDEIGDAWVSNVQIFNLTHIFGSGNEPTLEVFESYLTQDYYVHGSNDVYIGMHDVVYDDTDIGSQMFYCLYNSVDKYFNMGNVFNLNGVYHWFITNIMGGSSPLALYIVWQIVLYEFVMDLLFLLYGLFMWFIDMCEHLMEKPFKSIK